MRGRRAGSGVGKYEYTEERPKQSRKRFNCITKTIHFAHLSILFTYGLHPEQAPGLIISPKENGSISDPKSPLKIN